MEQDAGLEKVNSNAVFDTLGVSPGDIVSMEQLLELIDGSECDAVTKDAMRTIADEIYEIAKNETLNAVVDVVGTPFVVLTDPSDNARMKVESIIVHVEQAFGDNARYKGRKVEPEFVLRPVNLYVESKDCNGEYFGGFVSRLSDELIFAIEEVLKEADAREEKRKADQYEEDSNVEVKTKAW